MDNVPPVVALALDAVAAAIVAKGKKPGEPWFDGSDKNYQMFVLNRNNQDCGHATIWASGSWSVYLGSYERGRIVARGNAAEEVR